MSTPHASLPPHLLAILQGKGPSLAHCNAPVQARATQRAPRFNVPPPPIDATQWDAPESHELNAVDNERGITYAVDAG